ncbi:hypothetical protein TraAM80_05752 [Trypanosoma rangeli]|uniref:Uncharacterized protein n=1 Tax=Trypanosoma rangeli TaxID=5698 RepID=A0A3S5IR07_TRYRA|nr:uncharacterized protein TraAM80_05752 [Trypanosoma rangeli]RNF03592.1 hypothetical protein TraAM80_05752 [Trypanosoma rangeli]|eukprot:RNF03592.1 hypothetical protein TraAM80_05752 [Trypanosoma rangeli]
MASVNVGEFDLMRYLHLSFLKDEKQLTQEERQALGEQRCQVMDERQYAGHCLQEKVARIREQYSLRCCAPKPKSYPRDADSKYGLFWFGRGRDDGDCDEQEKDVDDNAVVSRPQKHQQGEGEQEREPIHDDSESEDRSVKERFKVWRPIEGPPLRRDKAGSVSLVAAGSSQQPQRRALHSTLNTLPAARDGNSALTPPWAEDCRVGSGPKEGRISRVKRQHELYKRGVLPRGEDGIDDILRHARASQSLVLDLQKWRMREDEQHNQRALRRALDGQIIDKRRRQLAQLEEDLVHIYGPTMRHILNDAFGQNPSIQHPQPQQLDESLADNRNNSDNDLFLMLRRKESPQRRFRGRVLTEESRLREARLAWLSAWEDHKRRLSAAANRTPTTGKFGDDTFSCATTDPLSPSFCRSHQQSSDQVVTAERRCHDPPHQRYRFLSEEKRKADMIGINSSTSFSF